MRQAINNHGDNPLTWSQVHVQCLEPWLLTTRLMYPTAPFKLDQWLVFGSLLLWNIASPLNLGLGATQPCDRIELFAPRDRASHRELPPGRLGFENKPPVLPPGDEAKRQAVPQLCSRVTVDIFELIPLEGQAVCCLERKTTRKTETVATQVF